MKTVLIIATAIILFVSVPASYVAFWVLPGMAQDLHNTAVQATATLDAAAVALSNVPPTVARESAAWRAVLDAQAAAYRLEFRRQGNTFRAALERQAEPVSAAMVRTLDGTTAATSAIQQTAVAVRPVLVDADELLQQSSSTVAVLRPQLLGLAAAGKITAGNTAQITREGARIAPQVAQDAAAIGKNVRRATGWPMIVLGAIKLVGKKLLFFL